MCLNEKNRFRSDCLEQRHPGLYPFIATSLKQNALQNVVEKKEKAGDQHVLIFP